MSDRLNQQNARVVDPVLTTHIQGYRHPDHVGHLLFPHVPVPARGGQILEFGKESFRDYNARRTPGASTKTITFGYEGKAFALVQDRLLGAVPLEHMEDAANVPGVDLGQRAVNVVMRTLALELEREQATLATTASKYDNDHTKTLSASARWSASAGKPLDDIKNAREAIRTTTGMYPTVLVMGPKVWEAVRAHATVIERFKYTHSGPVSLEQFARLIDVERVAVGNAVSADDAGAFSDIWGKHAILAYANLGSMGAEEPSFGYTYTLTGNPMVEAPYWDNDRKSWLYPVTYERMPVLSGIKAGYLVKDAVA